MRLKIVRILARREVRDSLRARWHVLGAACFAVLAVAVAELGMGGAARWGISAVDRTAAALLNLVLLFVPLVGITLASASFSGEKDDGVLAYLLAQPVRRSEVFAGKLLGLCAGMTGFVATGLGLVAVWIGISGAMTSVAFWGLAAGAWSLGIVSVALGALLALLARSRIQALALSVAGWIALVFLCDFGILALAAARLLGPGVLFGLTVANPVQAVKTLTALMISERLEILGPAGVHAVRVAGRGGLAALLAGSLVLWCAALGAAAFARFRKENFA